MQIFLYIVIGYSIYWSTKIAALLIGSALVVASVVFLLQTSFWIIENAPYAQQFVCEFVYYETVGFLWRRFRRRSPDVDSPWPEWRPVAVLLPSDPFAKKSWFDVLRIDSSDEEDYADDSSISSPRISTIDFVEIRRRNSFWHTITLWRVSTTAAAGDRRRRLCDFHHFDQSPCGFDHYAIRAYENRGVVFVHLKRRQFDRFAWLYVYDIRYRASAKFDINWRWKNYFPRSPAAVLCLDRLVQNDRSIAGWKIRIVDGRREWYKTSKPRPNYDRTSRFRGIDPRNQGIWVTVLSNAVVELAIPFRGVEAISYDDVVFLRPMRRIRPLRSFEHFGFYDAEKERPTMVYDVVADSFRFYDSLRDFMRISVSMRRYRNRMPAFLYPPVLTDRESLLVRWNGVVIRTDLDAPTEKNA